MADKLVASLAKDPGRRKSLFTALTGRDGDVSGKADPQNTEAMLRAAYGTTQRGAIDTKTAAADLGVSQRTVQRWVAADTQKRSRPRADRLKALAAKARKAATTQAGRRQAMKDTRSSNRGQRMSRRGANVSITGMQGAGSKKGTYLRNRTISFQLSGAEVDALWLAYEQGGDQGASDWLTDQAGDKYLDGWQFETIGDLDMKPRG